MKTKVVEHLIPSLDDQVKAILEPLRSTVDDSQKRRKASDGRYSQLDAKHYDLEQYIRRQNTRISRFSEQAGENTDDIIVNFAKNVLKMDITHPYIDRGHRVGRKHPGRPT